MNAKLIVFMVASLSLCAWGERTSEWSSDFEGSFFNKKAVVEAPLLDKQTVLYSQGSLQAEVTPVENKIIVVAPKAKNEAVVWSEWLE
jgi:hypothetical protein